MTKSPENILIVTKAGHPDAPAQAAAIVTWLALRGVHADIAEHLLSPSQGALPVDGRDLVLVLGGDGTMISVAREVAGRAPMLGLNMGRLGFLAELSVDDWESSLRELLDNGMSFSERMGLAWDVVRDGDIVASGFVVNDLVINRGALARLVRLSMTLDGELLGSIRADGLVIATPTGSTAYSISSGGPIVHPGLSVYTVTPICPFLSNFKPLVLPGDTGLCVTVEESGTDAYLTLDGQDSQALEAGDEVRVFRASPGTKLVDVKDSNYVSRLRAKGVIE